MAANESDEFKQELEKIRIQMPGSGGTTVSILDDEVMLNMVQKQYPDWKEKGKVTSVPVARIPKLFLHNLQMAKSLEKIFKPTQKGDLAEKQLYMLFMAGNFSGLPGFLVFPNFDGSQMFDTKVAKVEIDQIVIHQTKGVFIFNVKNVGGKSASSQKMKDDIAKHRRFLRILALLNNTGEAKDIPIHTVVCNFNSADNKFKELAEETKELDDKTIVFNSKDLTAAEFPGAWIRILETFRDIPESSAPQLDILVARLIALSSMESSLELIHEQLASGYMQSVTRKEHLENQVKSFSGDETSTDAIVELSKITNHKGKEKYILWTKDQMQVISKVYEHLMGPEKGLRLLVTGCKGSGKTMLLIFLAKLAHHVLKSRSQSAQGKIVVFGGTMPSTLFLEHLRRHFKSTGITVLSNAC